MYMPLYMYAEARAEWSNVSPISFNLVGLKQGLTEPEHSHSIYVDYLISSQKSPVSPTRLPSTPSAVVVGIQSQA